MDIVDRLRKMSDMATTDNDLTDIAKAADEIERLREDKLDALAAVESENAFYQKEIERLRGALRKIVECGICRGCTNIALAALQEGE
jgi:soluble cytochrome b562